MAQIEDIVIEIEAWLLEYKSAADEALSALIEIETDDPHLKHIQDLALRALNIGAHNDPQKEDT